MIFPLPRHSEFPHRMNGNGTIDSICPRCYHTIATSTWEAELERIEATHVCEIEKIQFQIPLREARPKPVRAAIPLQRISA